MSSVFLSYSSKDVKLATRVQELLEARGYDVFRDKDRDEGIPAGTKWAEELFLNLERFRIVVFLATPASLESRWCHTELAVAIARRKHVVQISTRKMPVHPVLAATQSIGPIRDVEALVDKLVSDLGRVGLGPRDTASWDPNDSPYPGLDRLTEKYAAVLFGRDDDIEQVIDRLERPKPAPVLVVGPSGSGKSSLIRAGVVPELKRRPRNTVLVVDPGDDALRSVALELEQADPKSDAQRLLDDPAAFALAIERLAATTDDGRVVLVIDQAEDLVLPANRARAVELVTRLQAIDRDRLAVIVVLRSASLDAWMRDPEIGALTPGDPVQIRPLDRAALREVILGPAQLAGIRIEPDSLVEQILDDTVQGEALPLLAALLQELTKNHSRTNPTVITPTEYEAVGPVSRVIERRAQAAVADVRAKVGRFEADVVDSYLRLVAIDESRQPVRTQLVADDLPDDVAAIFGILEDYRLVTRDRRAIRVTAAVATAGTGQPPAAQEVLMAIHEAVFRAWAALKAAIDARLDALRIRTWLSHDAEEWAGAKRGQVALTGGRLDLALEWSSDNADEVTPEIRAYLDQAKRQRQRTRIARVAMVGLAAVVLVVGVVAFQAVQARNDAEASRLAADARANFGTRLDLGLLLALEARATSADPRFEGMPLVGLSQGPGPRRFEALQGVHTDSAALSADGSRAVLSFENVVNLWDVEGNSRVAALLGPPSISGISRDGSTLAIAYPMQDQPDLINIVSWPQDTPRLSCEVTGDIQTIAVSPANDFVVAVVDTPERSVVQTLSTSDCRGRTLDRLEDPVVDVDIADGRIALGTEHGAAIWDPVSDALDTWPTDDPSTVQAIAFGDGDRLGATSDSGDLFIWDASLPGSLPRQFPVFASDVVGGKLRFSTDLNAWIVGSQKGDLRVIGFDDKFTVGASATSLPMDNPFDDNDTDAHALDIAATGTGAVTVDEAGRIVTWDLFGTPPLGGRVFADARIDRLRVLPSGPLIAGGPDGVWQLDGVTGAILGHRATDSVTAIAPGANGWAIGLSTGEVLRTPGPVDALATVATVAGPVKAIAMLDSGGVASADHAGAVTVVEPSGASTVVDLGSPILSLASRGNWLFAGANDGTIHVIDMNGTPREATQSKKHTAEVNTLEVSRDGTTLVSGSDDRQVITWAIGSDGSLTTHWFLLGSTDRINTLALSPDGHWLASSGEDEHVILWNMDTADRVGDPIPVVREPVLAFGTGDRQLFISDDLEGVRRWDMRPEAWAKAACDIIGGRRLEVLERLEFLGTTDATPDRCGAP